MNLIKNNIYYILIVFFFIILTSYTLINPNNQQTYFFISSVSSVIALSVIYNLKEAKYINAKKQYEGSNQHTTNLKSLLDFSMETIILTNNHGIIKTINDAGLKTFGITEETIIGKNISDFLPEESKKNHLRIVELITNSRKKFHVNYFYKNRWFNCLYTPIIENKNNLLGIAIYARDITEEIKTSAILRKTIDRLTTAEKLTHLGYWEWNLVDNKIFWSPEMYNIFEVSPLGFIPTNKKTLSFIHPEDLTLFKSSLRNATNNSKQACFRIICPNGNIKYLQGNLISKIVNKTKVEHIFGTLIDISEQKKHEIELKLAKENSDRANREKTRFLAAASHDIRQPLHAMELLMKTLIETNLERDPDSIISKLSLSLNNLSTLIDNLLDTSKIDMGKIVPRKFVFPIDIIKNGLVDEYKTVAEQKKILINNIKSSANIYSDPIIIERILRNLISNAIRYTENGKITIGCRKNGSKVRIEVHDTGKGIDEKKHEQIFKEFEQIREQEKCKITGSGLGLYIVKNLAQMIGSEVKLRSKIGKGTCFYFDIETSADSK